MLRTFLKKNKKGFTLTELMIVVVIIGILTAIAIPIYGSVTKKAAISANNDNIRTLESVITQLTATYEISAGQITISPDGKVTAITGIDDLPNSIIGESNTKALLKAMPIPPKAYAKNYGTTYEIKAGVVYIGTHIAKMDADPEVSPTDTPDPEE